MQAKDLLEYRNKIIDAFKDGTFLSEHLKELDAADYAKTFINIKNRDEKKKKL